LHSSYPLTHTILKKQKIILILLSCTLNQQKAQHKNLTCQKAIMKRFGVKIILGRYELFSKLKLTSMKTFNALHSSTKSSFFDFIYFLNKKGGPDASEYEHFNKYVHSIPLMLSLGIITSDEIETMKAECDFLKTDVSVMGQMKLKLFGYAGDFLFIDRVYQRKVSRQYLKWDEYLMNEPAAQAVRNRKEYFKKLLQKKLKEQKQVSLLNLASGPARDLKEIYDLIDPKSLHTTCIDMDRKAIDYAKNLCGKYADEIDFINANVFKFQTDKKFDVIWSAGLFDYFNDQAFVQILKQLRLNVKEKGEMVIGNFSNSNPNRILMEVFTDWFLYHRDEEKLINLAMEAGVEKSNAFVEHEELGVNLFLRIKS